MTTTSTALVLVKAGPRTGKPVVSALRAAERVRLKTAAGIALSGVAALLISAVLASTGHDQIIIGGLMAFGGGLLIAGATVPGLPARPRPVRIIQRSSS